MLNNNNRFAVTTADEFKPAADDREQKKRTVAKRLLEVFGRGDNPKLRLELYNRCQDSVDLHDEGAYRIIASCVRSARTANDPGRYFAAAVSRRMREAGFFEDQLDF